MKDSIIVVVASIACQFLGVVIARVIGMADGLGVGIGMMAGIIIGMNFLIPYFEKRTKEEPQDN
jgi:uncharacterized protein YneF (UPF0154 family)